MIKTEDMIGMRFGRWTVVSIAESRRRSRIEHVLHCVCDCGTEKDVLKSSLMSGNSKSCGCLYLDNKKKSNEERRSKMIGRRYGRGVVIEFAGKRGRVDLWKLMCDCGNTYICDTAHLNNGHTLSCGCYHRDITTTHGGVAKKERLFGIWMGMRRRCNDPRNAGYKYYGGRGISVCQEWDTDYGAFRSWALANGYDDKLTLDRIDFNGNYCPENCRWATTAEQCRNTRYNRFEEMNGVTKTVAEWMDDYGVINRDTVYKRLAKG